MKHTAIQRDLFADWLYQVDCILGQLYGLVSGDCAHDWYGAFRAGDHPTRAVSAWRLDLLREYGVGEH